LFSVVDVENSLAKSLKTASYPYFANSSCGLFFRGEMSGRTLLIFLETRFLLRPVFAATSHRGVSRLGIDRFVGEIFCEVSA